MKKLIINADDFGYSFGVNKGIIEAHQNGIVTSTSVMVNTMAAQEASNLARYPQLSVGLHFVLENPLDAAAELAKQVEKFKSITGKAPTHIDVHKILSRSKELDEVLRAYSKKYAIPVRQLGFAKFISSYYGSHTNGDLSVHQFKLAIDQATDEYNEIMCHVGYCDDYLREHSSYNEMREQELQTLCDRSLRAYITEKNLQLINWRSIAL